MDERCHTTLDLQGFLGPQISTVASTMAISPATWRDKRRGKGQHSGKMHTWATARKLRENGDWKIKIEVGENKKIGIGWVLFSWKTSCRRRHYYIILFVAKEFTLFERGGGARRSFHCGITRRWLGGLFYSQFGIFGLCLNLVGYETSRRDFESYERTKFRLKTLNGTCH